MNSIRIFSITFGSLVKRLPMFKRILLLLVLLIPFVGSTQEDFPDNIDDVISWDFSVECVSANEVTIWMKVEQKDGWHIYSQVQPDGAIPMPTEFTWAESDDYSLSGKTKEYGAKLHDGDGYPERSFDGHQAKFSQKIKVKSKKDFEITLDYGYMACKMACLPPEFRTQKITIPGLDNMDCEDANESNEEASQEEASEEGDEDEELIEESGLDSALMAAIGNCEGFEFSGIFDPIKVIVPNAQRTGDKTYRVTVEVEIDSVFAMYALDNPKGYKSTFKLDDNDAIAKVEAYETKVEKKVGDTGYKYSLKIQQNVELKDTSNVPSLTGSLDIYLMGCDNDFHNIEPVELTYDLTTSLDNGERDKDSSLWIIFGLAFIGGFIALLTPCVFPMIPMTVSFFTKQSKTKAEGFRKAAFYAICIIVIYVILGVLVSSLAGPSVLNDMATNPTVNIIFFILFVVFAVSFLGAFEITLPSSWVNKSDKQADRGGLIGIFFMAFTLALVSFSCTGPIVGTVLVESATGGISGPIVAMLGFSLALALPFGLFAAFPGWLNSLPSSGGWLNTVKVVLGFIELALALKFLSNADLVQQWHLLERELFLALWIGIFLVLAIYLLGKIQFPHDSPMEKLSVGRGIFAIVVISFTIYLIPGMWGAPLKLISGFPPPMTYAESPYAIGGDVPEVEDGWPPSTHAHGHGINVIYDYDEAMAFAKEQGKPLLLDFTGWACVNCRKMEEFVWAHKTIAPIMAEDFIIASLYVDDRAPISDKYKGQKNRDGEEMVTVGDKWMDMQITQYQEVTQPMYVVVDHNENNLVGKANYQSHSEPEAFKSWLERAKTQFEESKNKKTISPEFEILD